MATAHHSCTTPDRTETRGRSVVGALAAVAAATLALSSCGVSGAPVDAGVRPAATEPVAGLEITDCPDWAAEVLTSTPTDSNIDADDWRAHFLDRSSELSAAAQQLSAADAAVIGDYADAVRNFGEDPLSPGASRQMGEAAANAIDIAARAC